MLELNAEASGKRQILAEIIKHFNYKHDPDNYKREAAQLRTRSLVNSQAGPGAGTGSQSKASKPLSISIQKISD